MKHVEFRDNVTKDLLWRALMPCVPEENDKLFYGVDGQATTEYELKSKEFTFAKPATVGETPITDCQYITIVYVTAL